MTAVPSEYLLCDDDEYITKYKCCGPQAWAFIQAASPADSSSTLRAPGSATVTIPVFALQITRLILL